MSTTRTIVIVDGSNVARCSAWRARMGRGASDHDLRRRLVDAVAGWIATAPDADEVHLVFDGAGPWAAGPTRITPAVTVVGSGTVSGDDIVIAIAKEHAAAGGPLWIVSSDRELRHVAGVAALREFGSDAFVQLLAASSEPSVEGSPSAPPLRRGISDLVSDDVRAKLERLRRGEA